MYTAYKLLFKTSQKALLNGSVVDKISYWNVKYNFSCWKTMRTCYGAENGWNIKDLVLPVTSHDLKEFCYWCDIQTMKTLCYKCYKGVHNWLSSELFRSFMHIPCLYIVYTKALGKLECLLFQTPSITSNQITTFWI